MASTHKNKKRMTIADLASLAGVSKTTASFILSGRAQQHRISQATCERVMALAETHNFCPNISARALRSQRTFTFGLVIPDLTNYGFSSTAKALEILCRQSGYQLLIASSDDDPDTEREQVTALVERQVDGLLVASAMTDDDFYRRLDCPVVQIDRHINSSTLPAVITDARQVTAQLVTRIVSECHELAYIGGLDTLSSEQHRYQGYIDGLAAARYELKPSLVSRGTFGRESGYRQIKALVAANNGTLPKGLFCSSFTLFEGILQYLKENGLLDASCHLATFDNHDLLDCMPFAVDSIAQDCSAMAAHGFELLMAQLIDPATAMVDSGSKTVLLPGIIHWRSGRAC